jgi:hypothetical protein
MDRRLEALLEEKGWSVIKDHTEQKTGIATPVIKVGTSSGPALLRFSIDEAQLRAYENLEKSKVAPKLIEHGMKSGAEWALVEWIEGVPFDIATMSEHEIEECTLEIIASATKLYVCAAPEKDKSELLDQAAKDEEIFEKELSLGKLGPPVVQIYERYWEQPKALHGDLVWANALRTPNGVMFIDPRESYGPIEKDLTWMASILISKVVTDGNNPYEALSIARGYIGSIGERVPFLSEESLRAWTSLGLLHVALLEKGFGTELAICRHIAIVGGLLYRL